MTKKEQSKIWLFVLINLGLLWLHRICFQSFIPFSALLSFGFHLWYVVNYFPKIDKD